MGKRTRKILREQDKKKKPNESELNFRRRLAKKKEKK